MYIYLASPGCVWWTPIWNLGQISGFTRLCYFYSWRQYFTQSFQNSPKMSILPFRGSVSLTPIWSLLSLAMWLHPPLLIYPLLCLKKKVLVIVSQFFAFLTPFSTALPGFVNNNLLPTSFYALFSIQIFLYLPSLLQQPVLVLRIDVSTPPTLGGLVFSKLSLPYLRFHLTSLYLEQYVFS